MNDTVFQAVTLIIPLIIAIVFHEVAHGWVARALGDPTAAEQNRLSLNPLRHVDPVGTILVPGALALMKLPVFGWAKPVPVNFWRLRNPRAGMMAVAAAGPATNFALAAVSAVLLGLAIAALGTPDQVGLGARFLIANLVNLVLINVFIGVFNLLSIPPFDGSHIVQGLLPRDLAEAYGRLAKYGLLLVLLVIVVLPMISSQLDLIRAVVVPPVQWLSGQFFALAQAVSGR